MKNIYEFSEQQIKQVHGLYKQVWWAKQRTLDETVACVRGSQVCIGVIDEAEQLIGFVRVLSDFIYKAVIFDVIVAPEQRGSGLGKRLIKLVQEHHRLCNVKHFELYCLPEMESFYESMGFSADVGGIRLLRYQNS